MGDARADSARLGDDLFAREVVPVARDLIGTTLLVEGVGGMIVETEAYDASEPASHSFGGPTRRNAAMFGAAGRAYVYRIYGLHWCLNAVCGSERTGSAVLIRALQPIHGIDLMSARRGSSDLRALCPGPGKLCQALGVTNALDGAVIGADQLEIRAGDPAGEIAVAPRIGITRATDLP